MGREEDDKKLPPPPTFRAPPVAEAEDPSTPSPAKVQPSPSLPSKPTPTPTPTPAAVQPSPSLPSKPTPTPTPTPPSPVAKKTKAAAAKPTVSIYKTPEQAIPWEVPVPGVKKEATPGVAGMRVAPQVSNEAEYLYKLPEPAVGVAFAPTPEAMAENVQTRVKKTSMEPVRICDLVRIRSEDGASRTEGQQRAINKICKDWAEKTIKKTNQDIAKEYQEIKDDPAINGLTFDACIKAPQKLRRYPLLVWDRTRVALRLKEDKELLNNDFVHANYVTGFYTSRDYILTQGPLEETVRDFWGMVWQEEVALIAMLCQCQESAGGTGKGKPEPESKEKSAQYWSEDVEGVVDVGERCMSIKTERVEMVQDEELAGVEVCLSELSVEREGEQMRTVFHYQILNWPDQDVPKSPLGIFRLQKLIREKERLLQVAGLIQPFAPLLVHCSAGVGRSGTFVTMEQARYLLLETIGPPLELPELVKRIRKERHFSVQTEQQYFYIYQSLLTLLKDRNIIPGDTPIPFAPRCPPPPGLPAFNAPANPPPPPPKRSKSNNTLFMRRNSNISKNKKKKKKE